MRSLKRRPSSDALRSQVRGRSGRLGRVLYLSALFGLMLWLADAFAGHLVYLRAQGLVVSDAAELASEYTATVSEVAVERGDRVEQGDLLARLRSQDVSERIARIAADVAETQGRLTEGVADLAARRRLLGEAERRLESARQVRAQFDQAQAQGLVSKREQLSVANDYYQALSEVESLKSAIEGLSAENDALRTRVARAENALAALREQFDDGALRAPFSGLVTDVMVLSGAVVTAGEPVARIADKGRYVLAYRATGTLYDVAVGETVEVTDGVARYPATVSAVLPLTAQLPEEFRQTFRPAEREQVLRVDFTGDPDRRPPLFATVEVHRPGWWIEHRLDDLRRTVEQRFGWRQEAGG
ncbi:MAG: biotin/lipoyl-binding protein [Marivibrio sp.]|uniref:HlyD family secretion protein n=1 Tax=Marivibrio sp. TaxID=2039719 RepID=UPI0032EDD045